MNAPLSDPNQSSKKDFPPTSLEAVGCLLLPGCMGNFVVALISFGIVLQVAFMVNAWVQGQPIPWIRPQIQPGLMYVVWLILSGVAGRAIRAGDRHPWVYWITTVCLGGWVYMAITTTAITINYPGASELDQRRAGSWIATIITGFFFLRFTLSGKNRAYFGISRQP